MVENIGAGGLFRANPKIIWRNGSIKREIAPAASDLRDRWLRPCLP
jgi:hypothetical protein